MNGDAGMGQLMYGPAGTLRNGWKLLLFIPGLGAASYAAFHLAGLFGWSGGSPWLPAPGISFLACLAATWMFLQFEDRPLAAIGLDLQRRRGREFLFGALGGAALMASTGLAIYLADGCHWLRTPGVGALRLLQGAWLYLAVALSEELLFRGYCFQRLEEGLGAGATLALTGLGFALAHWGNPGMTGPTRLWATLNIGLAALLLGLAYLRTRSLALPIGIHLGWNWTQGSLLGFGVSGTREAGWWTPVFHARPAWLTGGAFGLEASLPCALLCAAACVALALWPDPETLD
jgi:membrane protease YdiL (CAAX protease family)